MSVRRSTITDLSNYIKTILRPGTPHKGRGWPTIAQLPGDIKDPDQPRFKPNLVAYQVHVHCSLQPKCNVGLEAHIIYWMPFMPNFLEKNMTIIVITRSPFV